MNLAEAKKWVNEQAGYDNQNAMSIKDTLNAVIDLLQRLEGSKPDDAPVERKGPFDEKREPEPPKEPEPKPEPEPPKEPTEPPKEPPK